MVMMIVDETNNHYRLADYKRWQSQDCVLGIEILRSKSAKCSCETCDNMNGIYPKSFKFQGWCDGCKCMQVPIMLEGEAYVDYLLSGVVPESLVVKMIPRKALEYINNNQEKLKKYYWVEELLNLNHE